MWPLLLLLADAPGQTKLVQAASSLPKSFDLNFRQGISLGYQCAHTERKVAN